VKSSTFSSFLAGHHQWLKRTVNESEDCSGWKITVAGCEFHYYLFQGRQGRQMYHSKSIENKWL
jgi:hypothetical protein